MTGAKRVFVVAGDLVDGKDVGIDQVLTWPSLGDLSEFCDRSRRAGPREGYIKKVAIGQSGSVITGGMSIPYRTDAEQAESWLVKLGDDRFVSSPRPGDVFTLLEHQWQYTEGSAMWRLHVTGSGRITVAEAGLPAVTGIEGA